nr:MFS transporter [Bacillus stercoris]
MASFIVASFTFMSKAGSFFVGGIINKLGLKPSLLIGLFGSAFTLLMITYFSNYFILLFFIVTLGFFISLYNIALKTHISMLEEAKRLNAYALLNIAVNVGASLGPLLGGLILDWNSYYLLIVSMLNYVFAGLVAILLPNSKLGLKENLNIFNFIKYRKDKKGFNTFLKFTLFSSLFWFLYTQIFTTFPIVFSHELSGKTIGVLFTINAITIILIQGVFPKIQPYIRRELWYSIAFMLIGVSFFVLWLYPQFPFVVIAIILFSFSEIIWVPSIDNELVANRGGLSSSWAFGVAGVIWGFGESIGSFVGLNFYYYFNDRTFLILFIISLIIFLTHILKIKFNNKLSKSSEYLEEEKV